MDLDYLRQIEEAVAKRGYGLQWHVMAGYIIAQTLGLDWYQRNCATGSHRPAPFNQNLAEDVLALEYHLNVVRLGHMLFLLRHSPGFDHLVAELSGRDFEPVFFELHAAALLVQNGYTIKFIERTGIKGEDYDLEAEVDGTSVAVEVKARRRGPIHTCSALKNALKKAKDQLAREKPGVICVAISSEYKAKEKGHHAEGKIKKTIEVFLNSTKRVNGVLVFWHRWLGDPAKCQTIVTEYRNHYARNRLERDWLIRPVLGLPDEFGVQNGFPSFMTEAQQKNEVGRLKQG